ncbi:hypothetical protein ACFX13_012033 [Malus domestica]
MVGYRTRELGFGRSNEGCIRAKASSYVNTTLVIDRLEVLHDVLYLLEDLANGQGEEAAPNPSSLFPVQPRQQREEVAPSRDQ